MTTRITIELSDEKLERLDVTPEDIARVTNHLVMDAMYEFKSRRRYADEGMENARSYVEDRYGYGESCTYGDEPSHKNPAITRREAKIQEVYLRCVIASAIHSGNTTVDQVDSAEEVCSDDRVQEAKEKAVVLAIKNRS